MEKLEISIPTIFGLESITAFEARKLGGEDVRIIDGRVDLCGDLSTVARANLWIRSGERVLLRLGTFPARTFDELFEGVRALPLEHYIGRDDAFPVKGWSLKSALHSIPDCQSIVKKACVERLKSRYGISWFAETGPVHQLQFSIMNDQAVLFLDTSGAGLHKRGYRQLANEAPIKETLAAGILDLARVDGKTTLIDPFCGSGTLLIEGALRALRIAPGLNRRFSCEKWDLFGPEIFSQARQEAAAHIDREAPFRAYGSDVNAGSVGLTAANAKKAGVSSRVHVSQTDIREFSLPDVEAPVIVCNPPYGERMLEVQQARELYQIMGRVIPEKTPLYVITPDEEFESLFGRRAKKRRKLYNGMLKCQLYMYF